MLQFKTEKQAQEWEIVRAQERAEAGACLLAPVVLFINDVSLQVADREALVTQFWRPEVDQKAINELLGRRAGRRSVHEFWRGADFRSWIYTWDQIQEIVRRVNATFEYRTNSGRVLKVLAYHVRGTARHLHAQVPTGAIWVRATR